MAVREIKGRNKRDSVKNVKGLAILPSNCESVKMRKSRIKIREGEGSAVYHCVTRTVNREMLFDGVAKEVLRKQIWRIADFSGVEILTYCVMTNHFHVLVRVPDRREVEIPDEELIRRYRVLYPQPTQYQVAAVEGLRETLKEGGEEAEELRRRLLERMHDISEFMKSLKQRFSVWYNRSHGRVGTLWSERFKSTLVEESYLALRIVAAYVDLNPVRAGLAEDPKDYRWSGYGEATGGSAVARLGIVSAVAETPAHSSWRSVSATYRRVLYCKGASPAPGKGGSAGIISEKHWKREMERGARLPVAAAVRCRVRYFTDGGVIGSREYVQDIFESFRAQFGSKRRSGPRRMKGSDWEGLTVLRDLRTEVFG